ncbi:AAA family ATPase (plasmid) [Deinococcus sp. KNUC1210]|uniref:AAA family ATPase n=1 Tax=Deinococcus sp. KNUC1210 TaxID=2917691 RepID=UPI001EF0F916|nr:AAA family ATPase [Deinococcus sp. KNUC1210]ULH18069.1 AAA family ATPase [Deinococcus sp. KNUC1210]
MTATPTQVHGVVERTWRTATGEDACRLKLTDGAMLTLTGPLPPLKRGHQLKAELQGNVLLSAHRVIRERDIAAAFYGQITGLARHGVAKIVAQLEDDTHRIIQHEAQRLSGVRGFPASSVRAMQTHARRQGRWYTTFQDLAALGLAPEYAQPLIRQDGAGAVQVFRDNPYRAVQQRIPLRVLDAAARQQGLSIFDPRRGPALVYELVQRALQEDGHTCVPRTLLKKVLMQDHALEEEEAELALQAAVDDGYVMAFQQMLAAPTPYHEEVRLADDIARLLTADLPPLPLPAVLPNLSSEQRAAVQLACTTALCVITSGPGTGKTTTLKALLDTLDTAGLSTILCAPTGKAASRMQQSTGRFATTLHRLLGYDGHRFETGLLQTQAVVVDEVSMASNALLAALLRSAPTGCRVILVGDEDQLPPIDPGHPLAALIRTVPTARLTRTHRQAQDSPILTLARLLISGERPRDTGIAFHETVTTEAVVQLMQAHVQESGPPILLTAGRAGPLGVDALNPALQAALNPGTGRFRVGDPVLVTRNDHTTGLMNGMTGRVLRVGEQLECCFDDTVHTLGPDAQLQLSLAYALTIHRAQGSEWDRVLVVLSDEHHRLLSRQLAYTAVTRAKRQLIAAGHRQAWNTAALTGATVRFSLLEALLRT